MSFAKTYAEAKATHKPLSRKSSLRRTGIKSQPVSLSEGEKVSHRQDTRKRKSVSKASRVKRFKILRAGSIWSQAVRQRDDHRCKRCGKRDEKNNHAHHVAPRSRRPDLRSDMSNGITVCADCHAWIHSHPIEAETLGLLSSATYEKARKSK